MLSFEKNLSREEILLFNSSNNNSFLRFLFAQIKVQVFLKLLFTLSWCLLFPLIGKAQLESFGNVVPPSPRSVEFEKFINYKVSLSNGLPEIGINFYNIQVDNVTIPIGISYHASGIKYGQSNGDVGLGWGLTSNYRVSRTVYGRVDEIYDMPDMNNVGPNNDPIRTYINSLPTPYQKDKYLARYVNPREQAFVTAVQSDYLDGQFDLFTVGLPSQSGNFIITDRVAKKVSLLNNSGLKVNYTIGTAGIDGISITDINGIKYNMGQNEANSENLQILSGGVMKKYSSAWMLSDITTPFNNVINFQYQPFQETREGTAAYSRTLKEAGVYGASNICIEGMDFNNTSNGVSSVYNTSLLSVINGVNETVTFSRNANGTIGNIQIRKKNNELLKKITFYHSQFGSKAFLDSVLVSGSDGVNVERYKFDYESKGVSYNYYDNFGYYQSSGLSGYAPQVDGLEYYQVPCSHLIPAPWSISGSSRENYTTTNIYMLKKITYPTGGNVQYVYEPNRYKSNGAYTATNGGGMRIRSINSDDGSGASILKRDFAYGSDSDGSGKMLFNVNNPKLLVREYIVPFYHTDTYNSSKVVVARQRTVNTNLEGDLADAYVKDNMGWYNQVREMYGDGYVDHLFTMPYYSLGVDSYITNLSYIYPTITQNVISPTYYVKGYYYWNKPVISGRNTYVKDNAGDFKIKKKEQFSYNFPNPDNSNNEFIGFKVTAFAKATGAPFIDLNNTPTLYTDLGINSMFSYDTYKIIGGDVTLKTKTIVDYENISDSLKTTYDYGYIVGNLIAEEKIANSKSELITTKYKYPSDFAGITANDNLSVGVKQLQLANILSPVIEKSTFRSNLNGTNSKLIQSSFTSYKPTLPLPDKVYSVEPVSGLSTFVPAAVQAGAVIRDNKYNEQLSFNQYTNKGKMLSVNKPLAEPISYKWGYGEQYPIAEVKNSALNEFYLQNFEEPELGLDFEANVFYDNSRSHTGKYSGRIINSNSTEMVSHSSKRLNISLAAPKKFTFSGWVYSNGPTVQLFLFMMKAGETGYNTYNDHMLTAVTNKWVYMKKEFLVPADVTQMFLRLDNNSAGTVWFDDLRIQPSDATMNSYTYEPMVGMTSAIDDSGKTVYYEYDAFLRLMSIRDQNWDIIKKYDYHYKP